MHALRVHDARGVGASQSEIRAALFPFSEAESGRKQIARLEQTARRYIEGRYLALLGLDHLPGPHTSRRFVDHSGRLDVRTQFVRYATADESF